MKRIDIHYGGQMYSVGGRDFAELQQEISAGIASGLSWLVVNEGDGDPREAHLLLTPGCSIALVPVPDQPTEKLARTDR